MSNDPKKSPDTLAQERPDPEVLPKAKRRKFTAKDMLAHIDAVASLRELNMATVQQLDHLAPFGQGNPRPVLVSHDMHAAGNLRRVGATGQHLQMRLAHDGVSAKAIAFGRGEMLDEIEDANRRVSVVYEPKINEWQGRQSVELEVVDMECFQG